MMFAETVTQNILIAILIIMIFSILFDILSRLKLFKRGLAAVIALIITLLGLQFGYIRALALKILQVTSGGVAIAIAIIIAIFFIVFAINSITGKRILMKKARRKT
jgi:hypothetical protein